MNDAERLEKAIELVVMLYRGKLDKSGNPAVLHPLSVMDKFPPSEHRLRTIAVLHDVLEDFGPSAEFIDLFSRPAEPELILTLGVLTKVVGKKYGDYIREIGESGRLDAIRVKLADLEHNLSRASGIPDEQERNRLVQRWTKARTYLLERKEKFDGDAGKGLY